VFWQAFVPMKFCCSFWVNFQTKNVVNLKN
jgi:hypothetical protein